MDKSSKKMVEVEVIVRDIKKERNRLKRYQEKFRRKEGGRK